jgi:recombination protein RecT
MTQIIKKPTNLQEALDAPSIKKRLNDVLGQRAPQFASSLITLVNQNRMLSEAEPYTIIGAAMQAAALDLPINQNLGFAYVVPYRNKDRVEAQFQLGYKGFIQLAMRSGQFLKLTDFIVPCGCAKSYNPITGELVVDFDLEQEGPPDGYGFHFELTNGFTKTAYWPMKKVIDHANRFSQSYTKGKSSPWQTDFDTMALKTVIKNTLAKYAPLSVEMMKGIETDQAVIDITDEQIAYPDNPTSEDPPEKPAEKPAPKSKAKKLAEKLKGKDAPDPRGPLGDNKDAPKDDTPPEKEEDLSEYPSKLQELQDKDGIDDDRVFAYAEQAKLIEAGAEELPDEVCKKLVDDWKKHKPLIESQPIG